MTDLEFDKLPSFLQWALTAGGIIAGIGAWILGHRNRVSSTEDATARERDRLQAQINSEALRRDLELVMKANRESYFVRLKETTDEIKSRLDKYEERLRDVEDAQARSEGRRPR